MAVLSGIPLRPPRPKRWVAGLARLASCVLLAWSCGVHAAGRSPSPECQLKAVFLFNFAQFVEWPESAFARPDAPLVIGVLGDDPFDGYLDDLVKGETVGARPIVTRRYRRVPEIGECHILYVCDSEVRRVDEIIAALKGRSILTVSDINPFARRGGVVRFYKEGGRVRFRINLQAAKAAGLTISSKILRPDTILTPTKE